MQQAFHPNATQYTLHLGHEIFALCQSINRDQSIRISNVTDGERSICLADINLISIDQWQDLISGELYQDIEEQLRLRPIKQCGSATRIPMKILSLRRRTHHWVKCRQPLLRAQVTSRDSGMFVTYLSIMAL